MGCSRVNNGEVMVKKWLIMVNMLLYIYIYIYTNIYIYIYSHLGVSMGVTPIAGWLISSGKYGQSYLEMDGNWG